MSAEAQLERQLDMTTELAPWIVGIDGSEGADAAARWALRHAAGRASELRLVCAWHLPVTAASPMAFGLPSQAATAIESSARSHLAELADLARGQLPVPVTTHTALGGAARLLMDVAGDDGLIIVGSRGMGGFARLVLGSTSTQVATHACVPTIVVPESAPTGELQRIVVAFDGSQNSIDALHWALDMAPPLSRVDVLTVWEPPMLFTELGGVVTTDAPPELREQIDQHVELARRRRSDVDLRAQFIQGSARADIRAASEDADLLVLGARGHGAVGSALLGSVSTWLLHHVRTATAVVPHTE